MPGCLFMSGLSPIIEIESRGKETLMLDLPRDAHTLKLIIRQRSLKTVTKKCEWSID